MRITKPVILTLLAAGALGAVTETGATPAPLAPGGSVNPLPTYSGPTPAYHIVASTPQQTMTENGMTVKFQEWAISTSLNPSGLVFAFGIETSNNPMSSLAATLPGYSGFLTAVEACGPFSSVMTCESTAPGMAARSGGTGDTLSFSSLGTTGVAPPVGPTTYLSNLNGIFTNASGWVDPQVTVMNNGTSFVFNGIGPSSNSSVPEPATLGLLALGLLGTGVAWRRRKH